MGVTPPEWEWCKITPIENKISYVNKTEGLKKGRRVASLINTEIAVLGHSEQQYESIKKQPYLNYRLLQDLQLGDFHKNFQNNAWAEARAYLCDDLFDYNNVDYVGVVSASWNIKYMPLAKIDNFHNWSTINNLSNKKTILTAELEPFYIWYDILFRIGYTEPFEVIKFLHATVKGMDEKRLVPLANQLICHKDIYIEVCDFMKEYVVILKDFVDSYTDKPFVENNEITNQRKYAYLCEAGCMAYLSTRRDWTFVPNTKVDYNWYDSKNMHKRLDGNFK
jgi:hypothetical protein